MSSHHRFLSTLLVCSVAILVHAQAPGGPVGRKRDVHFPVLAAVVPGAKVEWAIKIGPLAPVTAVAFRPDGRVLAVGSYGQLTLWDLHEGRPIRQVTDDLGTINDVKFSPDGTMVAAAGGQPSSRGEIRLYDARDGKPLATLMGHEDVVFSVAFRKDGKQLAAASFDHSVSLWDVAARKKVRDFSHHSDFVYAVAFDPAGAYLYSASKDRTAQMIDLATGKSKFTFSGAENDILAVAVSPDGKTVVSGGFDPQINWWSTTTGEKVKGTGGHGPAIQELAFHPKGTWLVSAGADRSMRITDAQTGALVKAFAVGASVYACALSPDGKFAASGSADGVARLWSTEGRLLASLVTTAGKLPQWQAITPQGYLAASDDLLKLGRWQAGGKVVPGVAATLIQPTFVARAMKGETIPDPKPLKK